MSSQQQQKSSTAPVAPHVSFVQVLSVDEHLQQQQTWKIPRGDIMHCPPSAEAMLDEQHELLQQQQYSKNQQQQKQLLKLCPRLCPAFDPSDPLNSCPAGFKCSMVHAILDRAAAPHQLHVNYVYADPAADCPYERYPASTGRFFVAVPNATTATEEIPSHLVLKTRVLQSNRRVMSHCAHFYYNRSCNRSDKCYFVHAISLTPAGSAPERKIFGRMTHAAPDGSPFPQQQQQDLNNNFSDTVSSVSDQQQHQQLNFDVESCATDLSGSGNNNNGIKPPPYASAAASLTCNCQFCSATASASLAAGSPVAACPLAPNSIVGAPDCGMLQQQQQQLYDDDEDEVEDDEEKEEDEECFDDADEDEEQQQQQQLALLHKNTAVVTEHGHCLGSMPPLAVPVPASVTAAAAAAAAAAAVSSKSTTPAEGLSPNSSVHGGVSPVPSVSPPLYHQQQQQQQQYEQPLQPLSNDSFSSFDAFAHSQYYYYYDMTAAAAPASYVAAAAPAPKVCKCAICQSRYGSGAGIYNNFEAGQQQEEKNNNTQQEEQLFFDDFVNDVPTGNKKKSINKNDDENDGEDDGCHSRPVSECGAAERSKFFNSHIPRVQTKFRYRNEPYSTEVCHVVVQRKKAIVPAPIHNKSGAKTVQAKRKL